MPRKGIAQNDRDGVGNTGNSSPSRSTASTTDNEAPLTNQHREAEKGVLEAGRHALHGGDDGTDENDVGVVEYDETSSQLGRYTNSPNLLDGGYGDGIDADHDFDAFSQASVSGELIIGDQRSEPLPWNRSTSPARSAGEIPRGGDSRRDVRAHNQVWSE